MKRYALFAGHEYYPVGGWHDFQGTFDTIEEAKEAARPQRIPGQPTSSWDWWHVIDLTTCEEVAEA